MQENYKRTGNLSFYNFEIIVFYCDSKTREEGERLYFCHSMVEIIGNGYIY